METNKNNTSRRQEKDLRLFKRIVITILISIYFVILYNSVEFVDKRELSQELIELSNGTTMHIIPVY